jgi:oxaloacetate decarboxylase gamma subunit
MNELLSSGIELMLIGMGIVFTFLAMLVVVINGMASVIQRFFPEDPRIIAAISAAIHEYRKKHHKH